MELHNKQINSGYGLLQKTLLIIILLLLGGCASKNINIEKEGALAKKGDVSEEKIDNIKMSEFILGAGDEIEISVYRHDDLRKSVNITSPGKIMFPLIGEICVVDKGIFELRDELEERLSKYLVAPHVIIDVTSVQSKKIIVLGEVANPGVFSLNNDINVVEAITKAGGATSDAKFSNIMLLRTQGKKPIMTALNLKTIFKEGDISQNMQLHHGDIVYVPATIISNISDFFSHFSQILSPFVNLASGIVLWDQAVSIIEGGGDEKSGQTPLTIPAR